MVLLPKLPKYGKKRGRPPSGEKKAPPKPKPKRKKKLGRPKKKGMDLRITNALTTTICKHVRAGNPLVVATEAVGISRTTLYDWLRRGNAAIKSKTTDPNELKLATFVRRINRATASGQMDDLERINLHGNKDWRAVAWKMEKRYKFYKPKGQEHKHEHTGKDGQPVQMQASLVEVNITEMLKALSPNAQREVIALLQQQPSTNPQALLPPPIDLLMEEAAAATTTLNGEDPSHDEEA